jgi:hypothetical protein
MKKVAMTVFYVFMILFVAAGVRSILTGTASTTEPEMKGYVMSLDAFNSGCVKEAVKGGVTTSVATNYCTCVYNSGVKKYGAEEFTKQMDAAGNSGDISRFNDLMNNCIERINAQEV